MVMLVVQIQFLNIGRFIILFCFVRGSHQEQRAGGMGKHILTQTKEELYNGPR